MGCNYDNELIEKLIKLLRGVNHILDDEPSELKIEKKDILMVLVLPLNNKDIYVNYITEI